MDVVGSAAPRGVPFTVALRADMDCLPVNDETGAAYKSQVPGYTHACGMTVHRVINKQLKNKKKNKKTKKQKTKKQKTKKKTSKRTNKQTKNISIPRFPLTFFFDCEKY